MTKSLFSRLGAGRTRPPEGAYSWRTLSAPIFGLALIGIWALSAPEESYGTAPAAISLVGVAVMLNGLAEAPSGLTWTATAVVRVLAIALLLGVLAPMFIWTEILEDALSFPAVLMAPYTCP